MQNLYLTFIEGSILTRKRKKEHRNKKTEFRMRAQRGNRFVQLIESYFIAKRIEEFPNNGASIVLVLCVF